ncbi:MAG: hypothetical protein LH480_14170 [Rubrivivax sp.]|nr:hypothetical protein [Rubrivivax sp.]
MTLQSPPPDAAQAWQQRAALFARWELAGLPSTQPTLGWSNALRAAEGDALTLDWPWRAPSARSADSAQVVVAWQRFDRSDGEQADTVRRVATLAPGVPLQLSVPPRAG